MKNQGDTKQCVGCGRDIWWDDSPYPICKDCQSGAGRIISKLKGELLAAKSENKKTLRRKAKA